MDPTSIFLVLMMMNWTKNNMLNTNHPLQKRRVGSITVQKGVNSPLASTSAKKNVDPKKGGILWQKKDFHKPDSTWLHGPPHAETLSASDDSGPCALLAKYFSHDIFTLLSEEIDLRYFTKEGGQLKVTPTEMRKLMGICNLMGNLNYPPSLSSKL